MLLKKIPLKCILGIVLAMLIFLPGFSRLQRLLSRNRELEKRLGRLEKENLQLSREIDRLKNDPLYLEEVAREEMKMGREGEIIYKVAPERK